MNRIILALVSLFVFNFVLAQTQITKHKIILSGHSNDLNAVSYSSRFNILASAGWDNSINFYKGDSTFKLLKTIKDAHRAQINIVKYNRIGNMLASASNDLVIKVYDSTYKNTKMLVAADGHTANINAITFENTSKVLFSGDGAGKIIIWNLDLQKKIKEINTGVAINSIAMGTDPRTLIVAGTEPNIKVINLGSGKVQSMFVGHTDMVNAIDISPNQRYLLSGSNDKSARLWDIRTGKEIRKLAVDCWKVTSVCFNADGKYCATGCNDGSIKIWHVETGKLVQNITAQNFNTRGLAIVNNNNSLAVAPLLKSGNEYGVRIYETSIIDSVLLLKTIKLNEKIAADSIKKANATMKQDSIKAFKLNQKMMADSVKNISTGLKKDSSSIKKPKPIGKPLPIQPKSDTVRIFQVPSIKN